MRLLPRFVLTVAVGLAGGLSLAADKVEIAHKPDLQPGTTFRDVSDTTLEQTLVLAGMNVETSVESHSATQTSVADKSSDGKTQLKGKFEFFIVSIDTPIGKFEFDSGKKSGDENAPGPLAPLNDLFRATSNAEWISTLNAKPEVEAIEFVGEPFAGLDANSSNEVTPQRFMDEANNHLHRYPDGPVAVGDKWERTEVSQIGNGQTLTFKKEFTYLGTEEKNGTTFDKVGVKSLSVDYELGDGSQLPLKLEGSELKIAASEGLMLYDRRQQMFTSEAEKLQITGTLSFTIDVNGKAQQLPGELDLTIDARQTSETQAK